MKLTLLLLFVPALLFANNLQDQEVSGPQTTKLLSIWQALIPIAVPLIITLLKNLIPKLPKKYVPFLAPLIGAVIDILLNLVDLGAGMGVVGAFMGLGGIGVRELVHNTSKAKPEPKYKI